MNPPVHGNPPGPSDPVQLATQLLALEVIHELFASTASRQLPQALVEQIRELSGARTVLALEHVQEPGPGQEPHRLLAVSPTRRAILFGSGALDRFCGALETADPFAGPLAAVQDDWISLPLRAQGQLIGALVLLDLPEPDRLQDLVATLNKLCPAIAMALRNALDHERVERQARDLEATVQQRTARLEHMLREKEILIRELYHRTKNTLQIVISMLSLQAANHPDNRDLQQVTAEVERRIEAISLVHEQLYGSQDLSELDMDQYFRSLLRLLAAGLEGAASPGTWTVAAAGVRLLLDSAIPLGLILTELVTNSCKHAGRPGQDLEISAGLEALADGWCRFTYRDNGPGLPPGLEPARAGSFGFRILCALADYQMGGRISLLPGPGFGLVLDFPLRSDQRRI